MRLLLALLLMLSLSVSALAAQNIKEESQTVTGYGSNPSAAIGDALVRAVGQLKGVKIDSKRICSQLSQENSYGQDGEWQEEFTSSEKVQQLLKTKTKGQLAGYQVIDVQEGENGYEARVEVKYHRFSEQGYSADNRRKLAVVPFATGKSRFMLLGDATPAAKVEEEFRNRLIDLFTQSRRLSILDRQYGEAFETEKDLWLSDDAASGETARLGNVRGVDYLVVGTIRSIWSKRYVEKIQLTGETISTYAGKAQVDYKIIQAATRQVKWSDTITVKFSDRNIRRMLSRFGSSQAGMTNAMAERVAQEALANIYPMRVVGVKGKTVIINQGGKSLKKGDKLHVYFVGEEMIDPYTKESLGQLEEKIATVQVIRPTAKVTYTRVIAGDAELIEAGAIIRRK
ncbi:CsgG/HfaB family protein [Desulfotalea psychrophila]|uniref:Probable periplasmic protein n=1 Tax=Desulfotalea psychrophila (strain LSv54 / DSM 12343) TaxID=177439 RepID=Q6AQQ4_DESPS|nr:CsgG/HfaB family protein [Desulfotalea psychrophila]CAG35319.1 probable periplasmic protein [Desulfotalea psychrophila LSv54]